MTNHIIKPSWAAEEHQSSSKKLLSTLAFAMTHPLPDQL
jgi:hypothetical protein